MSKTVRKPRFYFSFKSPFNWMASHRLEQLWPTWHDDFELVPYFEPDDRTWAVLAERGIDLHYVDMSKAKHLYILQDTKRLAAKHGLTMKWPIDQNPWWLLPHYAYLAARRDGQGKELYWALLEARWERGENICDAEVVQRVADSVGLDGEALVTASEDPELYEEGIQALGSAYMDDVFGVPFFKMGPHRFWGLDRVDDFLVHYSAATGTVVSREVQEQTQTQAASEHDDPLAGIPAGSLAFVGSADRDSAGGCG